MFSEKKAKLIIIITVFIDVLGLGIIIPVLPFFVEHIGGSQEWVIRLFAIFSLCAFLSTPILGSLSDRFGRRKILLASILSTSIGWFVFAAATNIWLLFLGRIIDGLAAGNISTAQSYLSDISRNKKERTHNMSIIGALFGVGFMIGPALGGLLGEISPTLPFWTVGALASINLILAFLFLPETNHKRNNNPISFNPFTPIKKALGSPKLKPTYVSWFLFAIAFSVMQSIAALYMNKVFGFGPSLIGALLAAQGVVLIINQVWVIKKFWLARFNEPTLMLISVGGMIIGFLLMAVPILWIFLLGVFVTILASPLFRATVTSESVGLAGEREQGEVLGILASIMSLGMIIGPALSEPIFVKSSNWPYIAGAILLSIIFFILYRVRHRLLGHSQPQNDVVAI